MPVSGTAPPIELIDQGVRDIDGDAYMLEEGDARWVYIVGRDNLYLETESLQIIMYA